MKTTTTPLSQTFDADGFPVPEALPENVVDPEVGLDEARKVPAAGAATAGTGTVAPELFGAPVGWEPAEVSAEIPTTPPAARGGMFTGPEALFGPSIDIPAGATPPIAIPDKTFADAGANLGDPLGAKPLVAVTAEPDDDSSTPRWMRDVQLDHSICRTCKHGWERVHAMPATSRTRTFFKYVISCCWRGGPWDVTESTVFHCSGYARAERWGSAGTPEATEPKPVRSIVEKIRAGLG